MTNIQQKVRILKVAFERKINKVERNLYITLTPLNHSNKSGNFVILYTVLGLCLFYLLYLFRECFFMDNLSTVSIF